MDIERRARIIATLGPATDRPGVMDQICKSGIDVARINLSHGTAAEHVERVGRLRQAAYQARRPIAVLADLPGPKLRALLSASKSLIAGETVQFARLPSRGDDIGVTEPECLDSIRPGQRILLDDGRLILRANEVTAEAILATVVVGGLLRPNKGINLPDTELKLPAVTDRDVAALQIAGKCEADWLALSFVRNADAAAELRRIAMTVGLSVPVLAKMERPEAVANAAAIIDAFDAIMVARGDLGVEIPLEQVPVVQKQLISQARRLGKPVVTATDMLDSMRSNSRPTRAEASDVANAIYDGTDAVMLSAETAIGEYPVEAVSYMDRIAKQAEAACERIAPHIDMQEDLPSTVVEMADSLRVAAIIVPTLSGRTAAQVARHRPLARIVAPVPNVEIQRRLSLVWGVRTVLLEQQINPGADRIEAAVRSAFSAGVASPGQRVLAVAGHAIEGGPRLPTVRLVLVGPAGQSLAP